MSTFLENRLLLLNEDDTTSIEYCPKSERILVGNAPNCDIRFYNDNVRKLHFIIFKDSFDGKVRKPFFPFILMSSYYFTIVFAFVFFHLGKS